MAIVNGYCTLAEVRASGRFPAGDTTDDALLERAVEAASRRIDGYCGRWFYKTSSTAISFYPVNIYLVATQDIANTTITVKTDNDGDGVFETTWTSGTDYILEPLNSSLNSWPYRRIVAISGKTFPLYVQPRLPSVQVTAFWGFDSVPHEVREATVILALRIYQRANSALGVAGFNDVGAVLVRNVDPDVQEMLKKYIIPGIA